MNVNMLKGKIKENDMTQEDVANKIGLSLSRFNAKLNETGGSGVFSWRSSEHEKTVQARARTGRPNFFHMKVS